MEQHSQDENPTTLSLAKELRKLNNRRSPGSWIQYKDTTLIVEGRPTPMVAHAGTIRAKENAAFLAFLAGNAEVIIERLERLARLEKMIGELPPLTESESQSEQRSAKPQPSKSQSQSGATVQDVVATCILRGIHAVVARVSDDAPSTTERRLRKANW